MAKNYDELARQIIQYVGGKENIASVTHCATRLRFKLHDVEKANTEALSKTPGMAKVLNAMGQYQIVIGNTVSDVYAVVCSQLDLESSPTSTEPAPDVPAEKKEGNGAGS